jgi:hypothetical protein
LPPAQSPGRAISIRPLHLPEAEQALYGASGRLRLLDPQVAQQPVERLLVVVVLLAAGEVADAVGGIGWPAAWI